MSKRPRAGKATRLTRQERRQGQGRSADTLLLLDKVLEILRTVRDGGPDSRLFANGVDIVQLSLSEGDARIDLTLRSTGGVSALDETELHDLAERAAAPFEAVPATGFVLLPQVTSGGYCWDSPTPDQFGTPGTIDAVVAIGQQWLASGAAPFGAGDISLERGGPMPGHTSGHRRGRNVDIRPLRKDGEQKPVRWQDAAYNRELTQILVDNLRGHPNCTKIFFNDPQINGVQPLAGHDNHLHVEMAR